MTAVSSRNLSKSVFQYIRVYTCVGSSFLGFIVVCVVCVECGVWCVSDWVWCVVLISAELNLNMAEYHYNLHKKCRCSKSWLPRHNLIHPYIHTYIHVHTRTYVHVHTYLHIYMYTMLTKCVQEWTQVMGTEDKRFIPCRFESREADLSLANFGIRPTQVDSTEWVRLSIEILRG